MNKTWPIIMQKDIKVALSNPLVFAPMLIVPLLMMVLMPAGLMIGAKFGVSSMQGLDLLMKHITYPSWVITPPQQMVYTSVQFMFPVLFLIIPIMCSSVLGASAFVSEKENKTMETLLYTPVPIKDIFLAKVLGTFFPAYLVTWIAFLGFGLVVNIGGWYYFQKILFPDVRWMIIILWLAPSIVLLSLIIIMIISARVKTYQEAQQVVGIVVVPVILLLIGQTTGLFFLTDKILFIAGAVLLLVDFILLRNVASKFSPEQLV